MKTIIIRFDGGIIRTEMPIAANYTGNMTLSFNWKDGKLLAASASKTSTATVEQELSTLQRGDDMEYNDIK